MRRPLTEPFVNQLEDEAVRRLENLRQFDADRGEFIDVKKAPVIDLLGRDAPVAQSVRLRADQLIEGVEAAPIAGLAFDLAQRRLDRADKLRALRAPAQQPALDDFLFAHALRDLLRVGRGAQREMFERGDDALEFRQEILRDTRGCEPVERGLQDHGVGAGRDRQPRLEVAEKECAGLELQLEFAALEHAPVLVAENGKEHAVVEVALERMPVDVEMRRVDRALPVLQHVGPPCIDRRTDAHVVRDEIDDLPEAVLVQSGDELIKILARADGGIQLIVIADVVAMQAVRARAEKGRRIDVADPEIAQVRHEVARLAEGEVLVELQAIGRRRDAGRSGFIRRFEKEKFGNGELNNVRGRSERIFPSRRSARIREENGVPLLPSSSLQRSWPPS